MEAGRPEQIADLIREAAILPARDELPHSIAVVVDELIDEPGAAVVVHASLYVERPGQRGIVLGARGTRLRDVGTAARREIERLVGRPVYLDLAVKVAPNWQRDPRQLRRLGV